MRISGGEGMGFSCFLLSKTVCARPRGCIACDYATLDATTLRRLESTRAQRMGELAPGHGEGERDGQHLRSDFAIRTLSNCVDLISPVGSRPRASSDENYEGLVSFFHARNPRGMRPTGRG